MACFATGTERLAAVSKPTLASHSGNVGTKGSGRCALRLTTAQSQPSAALLGTPQAAGRSPQCASFAATCDAHPLFQICRSHCQPPQHPNDSLNEHSSAAADQQQQTLWLPHMHSSLLQSQLQPAKELHEQLLLHQRQQQQQAACSSSANAMRDDDNSLPESCSTRSGLVRGMPAVAMTAAPAADEKMLETSQSLAASSVASSQSSSRGIRERMRQNLAAKASQSTANTTAVSQQPPAAETPNPTTISSKNNGISSSSEVRARLRQQLASRSGTPPAQGNSNDSNIAAVLQQLQKKLGQRYSGSAQPKQAVEGSKQQGNPAQVAKQQLETSTELTPQQKQETKAKSKQLAPPRSPAPPPQTLVHMLHSDAGRLTCTWDKAKTLLPEHEHSRTAISQLQASTAAAVTDLQNTLQKTGAPEAVRLRLMWDWQRNPALPADLGELQQKLVPFNDMASLLGGADIAAEILAKDSALMVLQQQQLQDRLLYLQQLVGSETADAGAQVQRTSSRSQPTAAVMSTPISSSGNLAAIRERLLSRQQSQDSATAGPAVSVEQSSYTSSNSSSVVPEALSLVRVAPGILMLGSDQLQQKLAAIQKALSLGGHQDVLQVLRHQPLLLDVRLQKLEAKAQALASSLELPLREVGILIRKQPLLLNLSASSWPRRVSSLKEVLSLPKQQFLQLITAKPGVLVYKPEKLKAKSVRLQALAGTHQDWDTELRRRLSPGSLVQLLTVGEERLLRAEYLVTIKAQHQQSMLYTIQVQKAHTFKKKFPGFEKWHREREQNQLTADDEVE